MRFIKANSTTLIFYFKAAVLIAVFIVLGNLIAVRNEQVAGDYQVRAAEENPSALNGQIIVDPNNPAWLKYKDGGYFFMAGPGDPEDFLYRGTRNSDGTRTGDQMDIVNKLKGTDANAIYMQAIRSHGGDGDSTHNPFNDSSNPNSGLNNNILNQWEKWFSEMEKNNIVIYFFFYDDAINVSKNLGWAMIGGNLHTQEKYFIETIVNKFEHHKNLIWAVMEEVQEMGGDFREHASKIAETIKAADNYKHPVAVHQLGLTTEGMGFIFPFDKNIDQFAIQYNALNVDGLHKGVLAEWENREVLGGSYNLNMAESALQRNLLSQGRRAELRKSYWATALAGAYIMVLGMDIINTPLDYLKDLGALRKFIESTDFYRMRPYDELKAGNTEYVLAYPGHSYIAYGSSLGRIGLKNMIAGKYKFKWLDAASGNVFEEEKQVSSGDNLWDKPAGFGSEAAVWITDGSKTGIAPSPFPKAIALAGGYKFEEKNGTLLMEAEHYTRNKGFVVESIKTRRLFDPEVEVFAEAAFSGYGGYSGDGYAAAHAGGERLDYDIYFNTPGTYYVFLRSLATHHQNNGFHAEFNNQNISVPAGTKGGIYAAKNGIYGWRWITFIKDTGIEPAPFVTFNVKTPGWHAFSVLKRESDTYLDKILLTNSNPCLNSSDSGLKYSRCLGYSDKGGNETFYNNMALPPAPPSNLNFDAITQKTVSLAWADNSNNEDGFYIYRSGSNIKPSAPYHINPVDDGDFTDGDNVPPEEPMACETTYYYWVEAYNSAGKSSALAGSVTTKACSGTKGDLNSDNKVDVIDIGILMSNWSKQDKGKHDLNSDGATNSQDFWGILMVWPGLFSVL